MLKIEDQSSSRDLTKHSCQNLTQDSKDSIDLLEQDGDLNPYKSYKQIQDYASG